MKQAFLRPSAFGLRVSSAAPIGPVLLAGARRRAGRLRRGPGLQTPRSGHTRGLPHLAADTNAPAGTNSFADLGWWQVFQDPQLSAYLSEALTNNWDIKIAAARVLQAEGALRVARSQFFPTVNAGGDLVDQPRLRRMAPSPIPSGLNPAARLR